MDKVSKLQPLLGEDQISTGADDSPWSHVKPKHLYEGTDSEDDEDIIRGRTEPPPSYWNPADAGAPGMIKFRVVGMLMLIAISEGMSDDREEIPSNEYQLTLGDLADEDLSFCPWHSVKKYPYMYVGVANRSKVSHSPQGQSISILIHLSKVAEAFFDQGKLFDRPWDLLVANHQYLLGPLLTNISLAASTSITPNLRRIFQQSCW